MRAATWSEKYIPSESRELQEPIDFVYGQITRWVGC